MGICVPVAFSASEAGAAIGTSSPLHESWLDPGILHRIANRFSAAMNDNGLHSHRFHENGIASEPCTAIAESYIHAARMVALGLFTTWFNEKIVNLPVQCGRCDKSEHVETENGTGSNHAPKRCPIFSK